MIITRLCITFLIFIISVSTAYATTAQEYMDWGYDKFKHGDYAKSINDFNNAIAENPNYAEAYAQRGFARQLLKDNIGAFEDLEKAFKLDSNNTTYKGSYQTLKKLIEKTKADIIVATRDLSINPKNILAYQNRGLSKEFLSDIDGAIVDYTKAVELDKNNPILYSKLADLEYQASNYQNAMNHYSQAIILKEKNNLPTTEEYYQRGLVNKAMHLYTNAIADLDKALQSANIDRKSLFIYQKGMIYYEIEDYKNAVNILGQLPVNEAQANYDNNIAYAQIYYYSAQYYDQTTIYNQTPTSMNQIILLYPSNKYAYNTRGIIYFGYKNYQAALSDFEMAVKLDPNYAEATKNIKTARAYLQNNQYYIDQGHAYMNEGKYNLAISAYTQAIFLHVSSISDIYVFMGNAHLKYGNYEQAKENYDLSLKYSLVNSSAQKGQEALSALNIGSKSSDSYMELGNNKYQQKNFLEAIQEYGKAIYIDPSPTTYRSRGDAKYAFGDYEGALYDYNKANDLNPNYDVFYNRALVEAILGNYEKAIADYDKSLQKDPKFAAAYENRGLAKYALENYKEAIKDYNTSISINPKRPSTYYNRGNAQKALNNYKGAISDYTQAIELGNTNSAEIYNARGFVKYLAGDAQGAIADYIKAITINSNYIEAYYNLGICYQFMKDYEKALNNFNKVIELNPQHENAYYNRATIEKYMKKYNEAIADYTAVINLNTKYALSYKDRGDIKELQNDYQGAITDWEKAIELNQNYANKLQPLINKAKESL